MHRWTFCLIFMLMLCQGSPAVPGDRPVVAATSSVSVPIDSNNAGKNGTNADGNENGTTHASSHDGSGRDLTGPMLVVLLVAGLLIGSARTQRPSAS